MRKLVLLAYLVSFGSPAIAAPQGTRIDLDLDPAKSVLNSCNANLRAMRITITDSVQLFDYAGNSLVTFPLVDGKGSGTYGRGQGAYTATFDKSTGKLEIRSYICKWDTTIQ